MASVLPLAHPWPARRRRACELAERWPFATEVLRFYEALAAVQERAFDAARTDLRRASDAAVYAAERAMPAVIETSAAGGPPALVQAVLERFHSSEPVQIVRAWLRGDEQDAVDRFLARAATGPVLEALGERAGDACAGPRDDRHCPLCGGLPQLAYLGASSEDLVTAHRYLECSRCARAWAFARMTCAACGEGETERLRVFCEVGTMEVERSASGGGGATLIKPGTAQAPLGGDARFPHVRIDGCTTCKRYLLTIDVSRDPGAVPSVDELGALPLDVRAKGLGLRKITPNLLGF